METNSANLYIVFNCLKTYAAFRQKFLFLTQKCIKIEYTKSNICSRRNFWWHLGLCRVMFQSTIRELQFFHVASSAQTMFCGFLAEDVASYLVFLNDCSNY